MLRGTWWIMVPMAPSRTRIRSAKLSMSVWTRSGISFLVSRFSFLVGCHDRSGARTRNEKRETCLLTSLTQAGLSGYGGVRNRFNRVLIEAVTEASNGADQARIGGVRLDFLAETQNVDVHGAISDGAIMAPDGIQELLAAVYDAWAAHQKIQQAEFGGCQGNFAAMPQNAATGAVQLQGPRSNSSNGHGLATELVLDAGDQLADKKGLHDIVVGAELQAQYPVGFRDFSG